LAPGTRFTKAAANVVRAVTWTGKMFKPAAMADDLPE
jgi:hypothetical protein